MTEKYKFKYFTQKDIDNFIKKHNLIYDSEIKNTYKLFKLYDQAFSGDTNKAIEIIELQTKIEE